MCAAFSPDDLPTRRQAADSPDDLMTREQAAGYMQMAPQTLAVWASTGRYGLPYIRVGRSVRYRRRDLDEFMARRTITSTSQLN
ncbi:MAG: helix-turn-helix domain-containing protein [Rhodopirellula sp.]|nr:helix-turn-helix domain-containing protein [Rhodopirellula sp.]